MANKKNKVNYEKLEREYVVNLRKKVNGVPRYRKTEKAITTLKEFIAKHMKVPDRDKRNVRLDKYVNEYLWAKGIKNPPMKIKVKAVREKDIVRVELVDFPANLKFKKEREMKMHSLAKESVNKKKSILEKAKEMKEEKSDAVEKETTSAIAERQIEKELSKEIKHETVAKKQTNVKDHSKGKMGY